MDQLTDQMDMLGLPAFVRKTPPDVVLVETTPKPEAKQATQEVANTGLAARFETMADKMQAAIDAKLSHDRQTNTPKRMAQAMSARVDGERLKRTQAALRGLARHHRAGTMPPELAAIKLKSKKAVHDLLGAILEPVSNGFHAYYHDTGEPKDESIEAHLLWQFSDPKSSEETQADHVAQLVRNLQFSKIPGYFPTPEPVIDLMLDHAQCEAHHSILEPSAGAGAIIDGIIARHGEGPLIVAHEINPSLCEILQAKGFDMRPDDFLEVAHAAQFRTGSFRFDRVLMNPPFEKLQDIDHVLAAFELLKAGGRLISIMSPGPFFRNDKKCKAFRDWLEGLGGELVELPANSFKESGTAVATCLIVVDRP